MVAGEEKNVVGLAAAAENILELVGEHVGRKGIEDTPARVAKMYLEMTEGLRVPAPEMTLFDRGENDQMVVVRDIDYYSICEHHLVPFYGKVHFGYVPTEHISGLSKFARVVEWYAKRPQIQERLTSQVADFVFQKLSPKGVVVVVEGHHLCMAMRGIKKANHATVTSAIRGEIHKQEFYDILKMRP